MDQKIVVKGMHCDACKALIKMEIEDLGLGDKVKEITLMEGENVGEIQSEDISSQELENIKTAINKLDQYKVQD
ncbi:MAG TPA: hypothetical protein PLS49_00755 [Candidatus Woesebacteria bacterium]|nr:hypothetical protein [Candidatus Woesebacteria bacterium]